MYLGRMRRLGHIRAVEDSGKKATNRPFKDCHIYRWQLDVLAWDYLYSMSMYDVALVRTDGRQPEVVALHRGIPLMVVKLIQHGTIPTFIAELVSFNGRFRVWQDRDKRDLSPWEMDLQALAREIRLRGFDPLARGRRKDAATPALERLLADVSLPVGIETIAARQLNGGRSPLRKIPISKPLRENLQLETTLNDSGDP